MRTLRKGDAGQNVVAWQRVLGITADGIFGHQTEVYTKAWQRLRGLAADGVVGPKTRAAADMADTEPVPPQPVIRGIDVSAMQGAVPWDAVAAAGVRYAIMRCAIGNEPRSDVRFRQNVEAARARGILPGGYVFTFPLPHLDPRAQARHHVRLLEGCGSSPGELLPMADLEWPPREEWKKQPDGSRLLTFPWKRWGCTATQIAEWCLAYLEEGRRLTGLHWGRYTYRYWAECVEMHKYPEFAEGPLWLADYWASGRVPTSAEIQRVKTIAPWREAAIIQHDGDGGLRLPNGVDADFNVLVGGDAELSALALGSGAWDDAPESAVRVAAEVPRPPILDEEIRGYRATRLLVEVPGARV